MPVYLHDIPLDEAQERLALALKMAGMHSQLGSELIPLDQYALGRTLAEAVFAQISSPHYHASAMDGFAIRAIDSNGALPNKPVSLPVFREAMMPENLSGSAVYLDTGEPLPDWADAVVPIELVEPLDANGQPAENPRQPALVQLRSAVTPWSHIRPIGEDLVATQLVLPGGHVLRPVDLGALAAAGLSELSVARKPRVAIMPTGSELVPPGTLVQPGDIIEFNSIVLAAQVNAWGGIATRLPIVRDEFELIRASVQEASRAHDLVLINAGSSAGSEDFTARVVAELGVLLVHGVAVRPGHPVIIGMLNPGKAGCPRPIPVIGVPGYPVSAALTGEIFVEPLIKRWLGRQPDEPQTITAQLTRKLVSPSGDDDYVRVVVGRVGEKLLAAPLSRGSGVITSLVRADGLAILPRGTQGLPAGAPVSVRLYRTPAELERTIFAIGSHDIALDLMAQFLAKNQRRFASANVGSLGGLVALSRGEAHLAGSHLLDPESGQYNLSYIRRYLPGIAVKVVSMVYRDQGLLVQPGNPLDLLSLKDLGRPEVMFVNRQRGAGTRVLLDYHLAQLGIASSRVRGYEREEFTHLAVAAAVKSNRADCGLGIAAAATALGLDFVPLFVEPYQLVIPDRYYHDPLLAPLLDWLRDPGYQHAISALPGYGSTGMGDIVAEFDGIDS